MADRYAVAPMLIPIAVSFNVPLGAATGAASLYYLAYGLLTAPVLVAGGLGRWRYRGSAPAVLAAHGVGG